jgi:UTP--glucose-1-phosphate uridylyltransferase
MTKKITKAVFPVAGLGSRFLPATKAQPKEMLTLVDKPLIQYAVEEAVAAGITELIFITGRNKRAIEDHFDTAYELESELEASNKTELLNLVKNVIPKSVACIYIRQPAALGLGHAVLCAKPIVGDSPFAVLLADDLMLPEPGQPNTTEQLVRMYEQEQASIVAVQDVPREQTNQYGIVSFDSYKHHLERVTDIVEKPAPNEAPSTLAVAGRYILDGAIFSYLEKIGKGSGGEIQLTDAIAAMLKEHPYLAYRFVATRYDCGSKLGYLKASVVLGMLHHEVGEEFKAYLQSIKI